MNRKLFVANLAYSVSEQELHATFAEVGLVHCVHLVTDQETGRSKGYAFIERASADDAAAAIERLSGTAINGRGDPRRPRQEAG